MGLILLIIVLIIMFGGLGYRTGGPFVGGGILGTILIILLICWLLGRV
jgi:hypothetical protein